MSVLALLAGLVFVVTLLLLITTIKYIGNDQSISKAQEDARNENYSGPLL
ncbi:hypothetical protein [Effusibacillus dendaii]|uniref:Uncharacterized protein n=1 Tax=Effusibacillus dendaii TaxID=2743772 RepID=A0A7I8D6Q5_9BACL|nr:hypothetical protein [Effusibacillus dendaii]BCJ85823.1 hypothetical protein skT53_08080 [Effusibacillus dendaii]